MNVNDVYKYGHNTVLKAVEGLPYDKWEEGGVCGVWGVKQIIAHLASYELLLIDALNTVLETGEPTPTLDHLFQTGERWNDAEVDARKDKTAEETWNEYCEVYERAKALVEQVPHEMLTQDGIVPWYGAEYDLEDMIVYANYAHKREHCAQIGVFRDRVE